MMGDMIKVNLFNFINYQRRLHLLDGYLNLKNNIKIIIDRKKTMFTYHRHYLSH